MLNYLLDCHITTPIGRLADIINHNNQAITDEFNNIYDSTKNRIVQSVYVPTGGVTAHFGEFKNLNCEYLTIKNIDSIKPSITAAVKRIVSDNISSHNILNGRFSNETIDELISKDTTYTHDATSIAYINGDTIQSLSSAINNIHNNIQNIDTSINQVYEKTDDIKKDVLKNSLSIKNIDTSISGLLSSINDLIDIVNSLQLQIIELKAEVEEANKKLEEING